MAGRELGPAGTEVERPTWPHRPPPGGLRWGQSLGGGEGVRAVHPPLHKNTLIAVVAVHLRAGGEAGRCQLGPRRMEKKWGVLGVGRDGRVTWDLWATVAAFNSRLGQWGKTLAPALRERVMELGAKPCSECLKFLGGEIFSTDEKLRQRD